MTTIQLLAKEYEAYIRQQLKSSEQTLLPSSTEDEELVRRAVFAVRNKSIVFERYISRAEMLYVTVQDVRPAMVEVDFLRKTIACSCPQKQMCRHKLAVLLSLYQHFGSVQDWAAAWRATKTLELKNLADERTPASWTKMADEVLSRQLTEGQKIEAFMLTVIRDDAMLKLSRMMPLEREWQPLFKLFMELMVFNRIWQHLNETDSDVQNGYFGHFVEQSCERISTFAEELSNRSRLFATDPFYDALQEMIRSLVTERTGEFVKRLDIFRMFWEILLYEKGRREKELALFEEMFRQAGSANPIGTDVDLPAIQTVFYILLRMTDKLESVQEHVQPTNAANYFELALFTKRIGELWATERLVRFILPHVNNYLNHWLSPVKRATFVRNLHRLFDGIELSEDEEIALYGAMGKFGLQPFSEYLIKNKRFTEWAALHQLYPSSISYLETCGMKDVLEEEPSAILPLLHVYAMEEVRGRSRINYKQAVRIWKRMKTAAKKAGKTTYFESYMQTMRSQNKRLRALLEEIEKGNLMA